MLAFLTIKAIISILKDKYVDYALTSIASVSLLIGFPVMLCVDILFSPFELLGFIAYLLRKGVK